MSASAGLVRYRLKDGTEATAEIEPNVFWKIPDDCVAITGWEWPPAGSGAGGRAQGPDSVAVKTDDQVRASYAYLYPDCKVARTVEVSDSVMVDVDAEGRPVGVEMLDGSDWTGALATLAIRGRLRIV